MERLNGYRIKLALVGVVAALVVGVGSAKADFVFGEPTNMGPLVNINSAYAWAANISIDGLELYFSSDRAGGYGGYDVWVATRPTTEDDWGSPTNLGPTVNSSSDDECPDISVDGLSLYLTSNRPGGHGAKDIWVATRDTTYDNWGEPVNLGSAVNSTADEIDASISTNGLELYFSGWRSGHARPGGYGHADLWVTRRVTKHDAWGEPVNLGPVVNRSSQDARPCLSFDGVLLFFDSQRAGGYGLIDLYVTRRSTKDDSWGDPVNLGPTVNNSSIQEHPNISGDGSTLFFDDGYHIWQTQIVPIVDFNGDRIVDAGDMCIMVDHWGEDYPLCDIGPMPWGDGVVDVQDLIVLAEHLFEQLPGRPIEP